VALEAFSQDEKPFETRTDLDEYDVAPDDGQDLDESSSSEDSDDDQTQHPDSAKVGDKFSSPEELMQAYKTAESRMLEKAREAEEYRRMLMRWGGCGSLLFAGTEEAFIKEIVILQRTVAASYDDKRNFRMVPGEDVGTDRWGRSRSGRFQALFESFSMTNSRLRPYSRNWNTDSRQRIFPTRPQLLRVSKKRELGKNDPRQPRSEK
jgi:hypothetical protein